jgi:MscS family membrane protein
MNFLDEIFLGNTIRSYCIVAGIILFVLLFKRYFSRYIAALLYRLFNHISKSVDKKNFVDLVVEPLEWLLVVSIAVLTIDKLNFPKYLQYKIYGHDIDEITSRLGIAIIVIFFTRFLLRIIDFIALVLAHKAEATHDKTDDQLVIFFRDFLKVIVGIIGVLMLVKACFNQPIGGLLTSLSIVGAAVALAAKESLENLIASFIIFFDKPFITGDTVKVNLITGQVEKIGLRSTRIRTADKTLVTVPNKQMVDSVVDNWSMRTNRRGEIKLELAVQTSTAKTQDLIAVIKKILQSKTDMISSSTVHLTEINKNGILIIAEYFTPHIHIETFNQLKEEVGFAVKDVLEKNGIEMASNTNTVTIINETKGE